MSQMMVCHKVKDFDKWKKIFDISDVIRRLYGEKDLKIFRNSEDPSDIAVLFEWNEPVKAVHYSQSEELRSAMKKAGVLGEPKVYLSDEDLKSRK